MNPKPSDSYVIPSTLPEIEALDSTELERVQQKVRMLISKRIEGIDYAERRRNQMVTQMAAVVAIGLALLPFVADSSRLFRWAYMPGSAALVVGGLVTWAVYAAQTNPRYAFLSAAQSRTWFYRQALPDMDGLASHSGSDDSFAAEHEKQFGEFAEVQVAIMSSNSLDVSDDLRQLFLLHQNEMTKNKQLKLLSKALTFTVGGAVLCSVIGGGAALLRDSNETVNRSSVVELDIGKVEASWRTTGAQRASGATVEAEVVIDLVVTNYQEQAIEVRSLSALDSSNRGIPIEVDLDPLVVAPESIASAGPFIAWVPASLTGDLESISIE